MVRQEADAPSEAGRTVPLNGGSSYRSRSSAVVGARLADPGRMRWFVVVLAVTGCSYYTVAPDDARRVAAMSREQRESISVEAVRDDGKVVRVRPAELRLVGPWHDGEPMHLQRPAHPAVTAGAVITVAGLVFVVSGGVVMAMGPSRTSSGNCDICGFSAGYGQQAVGGALLGIGIAEVVIGGVALAIGATRQNPDEVVAR